MHRHVCPEHVARAWRRVVTGFVTRQRRADLLGSDMPDPEGLRRAPCKGTDIPLGQDGSGRDPALGGGSAPQLPAPRAMTPADMERVRADFVATTRWASSGFDMLGCTARTATCCRLHHAAGDQRPDEYQADALREPPTLSLEVFTAVREVWPANGRCRCRSRPPTGSRAASRARMRSRSPAPSPPPGSTSSTCPRDRPRWTPAGLRPRSTRPRSATRCTTTPGCRPCGRRHHRGRPGRRRRRRRSRRPGALARPPSAIRSDAAHRAQFRHAGQAWPVQYRRAPAARARGQREGHHRMIGRAPRRWRDASTVVTAAGRASARPSPRRSAAEGANVTLMGAHAATLEAHAARAAPGPRGARTAG